MKIKNIIMVLLASAFLASCAPTAKVVSTETSITVSTFTPIPTLVPTITPTFVPTITPTLVPTIHLETISGVPYPDERELNNALQTYIETMGFTPNEVKTGMAFKEFKDIKGGLFVLALTANDAPLMIANQNKNGNYEWRTIGLKDIGEKINLSFGASYTLKLPGGQTLNDPKYLDLLERNFDAITISQGIYWKWLEPQQGTFDKYGLSDTSDQLKILEKIQPSIVNGQHLFFPSDYPDWLIKGNFNHDELIQIMRARVKSVLSLTKGKVSQWVVVNEPYFRTTKPQSGFDYERPDVLYKKLGTEYIETAFKISREETAPGTILLYNDLSNQSSSPNNYPNGLYTNLTRENIKLLKDKGLIDGLGMQMHIKAAYPPDKADMIKTMQSYGLPIYITEIDVDLTDVPGTQKERFDLQAKLYREALEACLESGVCNSFSFWDIGDHISWLVLYMNEPNADATLFDKNFKPKPAYFALLDVLVKRLQK